MTGAWARHSRTHRLFAGELPTLKTGIDFRDTSLSKGMNRDTTFPLSVALPGDGNLTANPPAVALPGDGNLTANPPAVALPEGGSLAS